MEKTNVEEVLPPSTLPPARKVVSVPDASGKVQKIRGRLLTALTLMTWGDKKGRPLQFEDAAPQAGLTVRALRKALDKPHVREFLTGERRKAREVFAAANPAVARVLRDTAKNGMVRLGAMKFLEGAPDDHRQTSLQPGVTPGVVVMVNVDRRSAPVDDTLYEVDGPPLTVVR
jgi:hypothetical protein